MSTLTPTLTPTSENESWKWLLAGALLIVFGFSFSIYMNWLIYKDIKRHIKIYKNILFWFGIICMIIGAILVTHRSTMDRHL
jgi:Na+/H+ antiporter NhaA